MTTQTFMAALTGLDGFRGEGPFGAWLVGIARRQIAMHFRRQRPVAGEEILERLGNDGDEDPEAAVDRHALLLRVLARLDRLAPERAEVIRLRYRVYDQDSAGDIAERLGFAGVTVLPTTGLPEGAPPPANVFEATEDSRSLTLGGASLWFYDTARTPTGEPIPNAIDQALAFLTERELLEARFTAVVEGGDGGNVFFFSQVAGLAVANQPAWWVGIGAGGVYLW